MSYFYYEVLFMFKNSKEMVPIASYSYAVR